MEIVNLEHADLVKRFGAIRCVYINKEEKFFLISKLGRPLVSRVERIGIGAHTKIITYNCSIIHEKKIVLPSDKKNIEYYLENYRENIKISPEFMVMNILNDKNTRIYSPKYLTPIKDLFRDVGLLSERRGTVKKRNETAEKRYQFVTDAYRKISRTEKNRLSLDRIVYIIRQKWIDEVFKEYKKPAERNKYSYTSTTIRRDIEKYIKK